MDKAETTRNNIQEKLLDMMENKSIDRVKVKEITDAINVTRGTFYLYYDSVYDVLQEIEDKFFEGFREINQSFVEYPLDDKYFFTPHPRIVESLKYMREKERLTKILYGPHGDVVFQNRCKMLIREFFFEKAVRENYIIENNDLIATFIIGGHRDMIVYWVMHGMETDDEEFAIMIYRLIFGFYHPKDS